MTCHIPFSADDNICHRRNRSSSPTPFGLVQDWQTPPFTQAPIAGHSGSQTCGTIPDASQRSIVTTHQQDSSGRAASKPSDHADYHYGSIIPEKEELEQQDPEDRARKSSSMYKVHCDSYLVP